jgi:hypothetical protein
MRDTIDMAREAGAIHIHGKPKEFAIVGNDSIKAFEALVRADAIADEREACAYRAGIALLGADLRNMKLTATIFLL